MSALLEVRRVSRSFGGLMALCEVSFSVRAGEIFGLIGPNGAGKTTLFNLITGIMPVSSGSVELRGGRLTGLPPHRIAAQGVARTFQNIRLFKGLSALENVQVAQHVRTRSGLFSGVFRTRACVAEERRVAERGREILELLGLAGRAGELAAQLSYGDQRRLELGRALALEPSVLLLDEPAAGMNAAEKQGLTALIRGVAGSFGLTVLLIEHHVPLVMELCDRIAVLNFGELITTGTPAEVRANPAVIEAYLGAE